MELVQIMRLRTFGTPPYDSWNTQVLSWNKWNTKYKDMEIVEDENYTHAAVFGLSKPHLLIPKDRVVGFCVEPYEIHNIYRNIDWITKNIGTYYCIDNTNLPKETFKNGMPYLGPCVDIYNMSIPTKTKKLSMIASSKCDLKGHKIRHEIIKKILNTSLDIDIYGRGLDLIYKDKRIKGSVEDKKLSLDDYMFSVAIENVEHKFWVTEKFYDPIMRGCVPIYWGAECVLREYGDCFIRINDNDILKLLFNVYNSAESLYNTKKIKEAQKIIKEKHNLPEAIWSHFNGR